LKTSKAGKGVKISGEIIYAYIEEEKEQDQEEETYTASENIKQLRIDGSGHKLSEEQSFNWIDSYRQMLEDIKEEATFDEVDSELSGTGAYLVRVRFHKRLPKTSP
jgi:hypothetical protein